MVGVNWWHDNSTMLQKSRKIDTSGTRKVDTSGTKISVLVHLVMIPINHLFFRRHSFLEQLNLHDWTSKQWGIFISPATIDLIK